MSFITKLIEGEMYITEHFLYGIGVNGEGLRFARPAPYVFIYLSYNKEENKHTILVDGKVFSVSDELITHDIIQNWIYKTDLSDYL